MDMIDEFQKLFNEIVSKKQNLQFSHASKKDLFEIWNNKQIQLNEAVEEYKKSFISQESAAEILDNIHNRLCGLLKSSTFSMEYVRKELEQLRNEIAQLNNFVVVAPDAPGIQVGDLNYIFRVVKLTDQMKDKDRLVHNMTHEMEDLKRKLHMYPQRRYLMNSELQPPYTQLQSTCTPSYQHDQPVEYQDFDQYSVGDNCTDQGITQLQTDNTRLQNQLDQCKQMILRLKRDAQTREEDFDLLERDLISTREKLDQTKADQERNQDKQVNVNHFHGPAYNLMNYSSQDNALQFGNHNRMA